jgi:magnesium and cobalt transporter
MQKLGRMPRRGEVLQVGELELRVLRADRRRVEALKVTAPRDLPPLEERGSAD